MIFCRFWASAKRTCRSTCEYIYDAKTFHSYFDLKLKVHAHMTVLHLNWPASASSGEYYTKRGSAGYIVREVHSMRDRQPERSERDGSDVNVAALKLAWVLHFLAKKSHFWFLLIEMVTVAALKLGISSHFPLQKNLNLCFCSQLEPQVTGWPKKKNRRQWRLFIKMATDWKVSEVGDTRTPTAGPGRGWSVQIEWISVWTAHLGFPALLSVPHLLAREIMMNRRHWSNVSLHRPTPSYRSFFPSKTWIKLMPKTTAIAEIFVHAFITGNAEVLPI